MSKIEKTFRVVTSGKTVDRRIINDQHDMWVAKYNNIKQFLRDLHDEIRSKANKAIGIYLQDSNLNRSIEHFELALKYNKNAGCKTLLDKVNKSSSTQNLNEEYSKKVGNFYSPTQMEAG